MIDGNFPALGRHNLTMGLKIAPWCFHKEREVVEVSFIIMVDWHKSELTDMSRSLLYEFQAFNNLGAKVMVMPVCMFFQQNLHLTWYTA